MSFFNAFHSDPFVSEFDHLFDQALARRARGDTQVQPQDTPRVIRPRVDVHEDKDKNLVTATFELPGISKQDVNIDVQNNLLTVSGEFKFDSGRDEHGYVVRERRFGRFSRSLPVSEGIKPEEIKAAMENGVLTVTYARQTKEQLPKRVTIS